jgi:hypothetical protein
MPQSKQLETQGHITLGFHLTGDGIYVAHKKIVKSKLKQYSESIISSSLRWGGSLEYNLYYMASLSYGTAETFFNFKEYEEIKRPVMNAILPENRVNRKTSSHVVFIRC